MVAAVIVCGPGDDKIVRWSTTGDACSEAAGDEPGDTSMLVRAGVCFLCAWLTRLASWFNACMKFDAFGVVGATGALELGAGSAANWSVFGRMEGAVSRLALGTSNGAVTGSSLGIGEELTDWVGGVVFAELVAFGLDGGVGEI